MSSETHRLTEKQMREFMSLKGAKGLKQKYDLEHSKGNNMLGSGMKGEGFWEDIGGWFWKAGQDVNKFLKDNKVISKGSKLAKYVLPALGMAEFIPATESAGEMAEKMGYGRGAMIEVRHPAHLKHYNDAVRGSGNLFNLPEPKARTDEEKKKGHEATLKFFEAIGKKFKGKGCDCCGSGYTPGLSTTGMGMGNGNQVLTVSRNGTLQMTAPTHLTNPGVGTLANGRVDAGTPSLSGIKSGLGRMTGCGVGAFGVISPVSGIKI